MEKYRIVRNESLRHHGILGMKWGKRNGPPYPLAPNKHSASEKKAGWQKSLNKNSPSMPQGGAAGGGGPTEEDEEDKKILDELYAELEAQAKRLGISPMEILSSQNFGLTLSEFTGKGDSLKNEDLNRLRQKAFQHYSKNPVDLALQTTRYTKNEAELIRDQINRGDRKAPSNDTSRRSNNTYTITDKGLQKEEDKSVWDKIKGKIFGETKVTFEDAKLTDKKDETKNTHTIDQVKTEWVDENTQKVGNLYVTHEASTVLNAEPTEYKTKTTFKDAVNEAKDWVNSLFGKSEKKTMTIQEYTKMENEWRAKGMSEAEIEKKIKDEYSDYTITYPNS